MGGTQTRSLNSLYSTHMYNDRPLSSGLIVEKFLSDRQLVQQDVFKQQLFLSVTFFELPDRGVTSMSARDLVLLLQLARGP